MSPHRSGRSPGPETFEKLVPPAKPGGISHHVIRGAGLILDLETKTGPGGVRCLTVTATHEGVNGEEVSSLEIRFKKKQQPGAQELVELREIMRHAGRIGGEAGQIYLLERCSELSRKFNSSYSVHRLGNGAIPVDVIPAMNRDLRAGLVTESLDTLTGLRTKVALYSESGVDALNARVPGKKLVVMLDFNHVRVANEMKLGRELEEVFKYVNEAALRSFGKRSIKYEVLRLGGDEFCIVCQDKSGALAAVTEMDTLLRRRREQSLSRKPERFKRAEKFAKLREAVRRNRTAYLRETGGRSRFSPESYRGWLLARLAELGDTKSHPRRGNGWLAVRLGKKLGAKIDQPVLMTAAFGNPVRIGSAPTVAAYLRAVAQGSKSVDAHKGAKLRRVVEAPDHGIKIRGATLQAMRITNKNVRELERQLRRLDGGSRQRGIVSRLERFAGLQSLTRKHGSDPAINFEVQRFANVAERKLAEFAGVKSKAPFLVVCVDIASFGVLNHQEGPDRTDGYFREIAKQVRHEFPGALIVREGGGRLYAFVPDAGDTEHARALLRLRHRAGSVLDYGISRELLEAGRSEHEEQLEVARALRGEGKEREKSASNSPKYGTVSVSSATLALDPDRSLAKTLKRVAKVKFDEV